MIYLFPKSQTTYQAISRTYIQNATPFSYYILENQRTEKEFLLLKVTKYLELKFSSSNM